MGNRAPNRATDVESPPSAPARPEITESTVVEVVSSSSAAIAVPVPQEQASPPVVPLVTLNVPTSLLPTSSGVLKTFMCRICLCYDELRHAFTASPCAHSFCIHCLAGYLTSQITDGQVELRCPYMNEENQRCETILSDENIAAVITDPNVITKLERFRAARQNPSLRVCPECNALKEGDAEQPAMVCAACGAAYCFTHSNAHAPAEPCADFEARVKEQDSVSQALVAKTSKPCPKCQALTYKYTGCNHMKCPRCGQDWCWLCGEGIVISGPYPRHYDRRNPTSSCAGMQFTTDENEEEQRNGCRRFLRMLFYYSPLSIPFYILAVLLYLVVCLVTAPCLLASPAYRACWLRRCIVLRIVTFCWGILLANLFFILLLVCLVVAWVVGIILGALCFPIFAIRNRSEIPRHISCCCCWPALLVSGLLNDNDE